MASRAVRIKSLFFTNYQLLYPTTETQNGLEEIGTFLRGLGLGMLSLQVSHFPLRELLPNTHTPWTAGISAFPVGQGFNQGNGYQLAPGGTKVGPWLSLSVPWTWGESEG